VSEEFDSPYPGYDVLDKWDTPSWNDATRRAVRERLEQVPRPIFLDEESWRALVAICDRLLPQPDRPVEPVPIAPFVDRKLERNEGDGYRFEGMPPLREAWRHGLRAIDLESEARYGPGFAELSEAQQDELLGLVQRGEVIAGAWKGLSPGRFFSDLLLKTVVGIYYAHPSAWNEIGYGGPASPRGYVRLGFDQRDPWEAKERRERE
jgi:hypothetical protein